MIRSLLIAALVVAVAMPAQARRSLPLMPAKRTVVAKRKTASRRGTPTAATASYRLPELGAGPDVPLPGGAVPPADSVKPAASSVSANPSEQTLGVGVEVGALAVPTSGANGFEPRFAPGARAYLRIPLSEKIYVKPSFGYFYQSYTENLAPVSRHVFELGGNLQYSILHGGNFRLLGGVAARVDLQLVQENNPFGQPLSSFQTAVRGGPALGALYGIAPSTSVSLDTEATYSTAGKIQFGVTAGVVFYWR